MSKSITIPRTDALTDDLSSLMPELIRVTGSESEAASILRSLERLGSDDSILGYELTRVVRGAKFGGVPNHAWRVRADRGRPVEPATEEPAEPAEPVEEPGA